MPFKNSLMHFKQTKELELSRCCSLKECLNSELDSYCLTGTNAVETRRIRFARLVGILQNMNAGKSGGGLSGAQATESIWKEMLKDINCGNGKFDLEPQEGDADFSYLGKSFSLKTIGFRNKSADLALAWSKNKPGAKQREFESAMVILSFRPSAPNSRTPFWKRAEQGIYIIPLSTLCSTVKNFAENNKTNTLIKAKYVVELMQIAKDTNLFLPLELSPSRWEGCELSFWKAGDACLVTKNKKADQ